MTRGGGWRRILPSCPSCCASDQARRARRTRRKENPRRWRRRGVRSKNYDEAHTSYRQWRLAIKPILWAGVTNDCARTPLPAALFRTRNGAIPPLRKPRRPSACDPFRGHLLTLETVGFGKGCALTYINGTGAWLALLFWKALDQAIPIPQIGANAIKHLFGLLGCSLVIVGNNRHNRRNQTILGVVEVEPIFVHIRIE